MRRRTVRAGVWQELAASLPFFSEVNLRQAANNLVARGFNVTVEQVDAAAAPARNSTRECCPELVHLDAVVHCHTHLPQGSKPDDLFVTSYGAGLASETSPLRPRGWPACT
jgi:hypothetical protein